MINQAWQSAAIVCKTLDNKQDMKRRNKQTKMISRREKQTLINQNSFHSKNRINSEHDQSHSVLEKRVASATGRRSSSRLNNNYFANCGVCLASTRSINRIAPRRRSGLNSNQRKLAYNAQHNGLWRLFSQYQPKASTQSIAPHRRSNRSQIKLAYNT